MPLLLGGVVGYVARDQGVGVVEPLGSGAPQSYGAPAYGDSSGYDTGAYDEPVY
ncbi:hypothetical protein HZ994_10945 [Akkermansiaceae bacterium]|nr:hypothetical protein HZ994_10945 [Akkermansiaceae bacterium]